MSVFINTCDHLCSKTRKAQRETTTYAPSVGGKARFSFARQTPPRVVRVGGNCTKRRFFVDAFDRFRYTERRQNETTCIYYPVLVNFFFFREYTIQLSHVSNTINFFTIYV